MKKTIQSLFALSAFGAAALFAQAQPAPKILVVDMAKLYDSHYKTEEQNNKLRSDEQKAQEELDRLNKEGNALVEKYKEFDEQSKNPAVTAEAKAKAQNDAARVIEDIRRKQTEVQSFQQNTRNSLQQRLQNFKALILEEISKVSVDIAKRKGATLLLDKSGPSLFLIPTVIYSDPGYDITDEVLAEINKGRPATVAAPAAAAPAAAPAADSSSDSPKITLPGVKKP
jgi:outer membrane protein